MNTWTNTADKLPPEGVAVLTRSGASYCDAVYTRGAWLGLPGRYRLQTPDAWRMLPIEESR